MTKQSDARAQVLDLIDRLGVGEAIPSERKLTVDLGMSRLTVRAALDDLVREGYLVRRRGAGTFVSEPKIAQELTMTSFTDDMRRRGLVPASRTLELNTVSAGARLGRLLHVSPSEPVVVVKRLRLADRETMAIEDLHVRASLVPSLTGPTSRTARSTSCSASATDHDRRRHADDRADGDERGGVGRARRPAATRRRSCSSASPLDERRDRRVRALDLPRRPLPLVTELSAPDARRSASRSRCTTVASVAERSGQYHRSGLLAMELPHRLGQCEKVVLTYDNHVTAFPRMASGTNQSAGRGDAPQAITRPARAWRLVNEGTKMVPSASSLVAALVLRSPRRGVTGATKKSSITVWLQVDAQSGWPDLVAAATTQFQKAHPGVGVDVQYQSWPDAPAKFDATLAAATRRRDRDG
jgi:DNA-binding transcriptional regulator YhcF (GntR family)